MLRASLLCSLIALCGLTPPAWAADEPIEPGLPHQVMINDVEFIYIPAGWFWHATNPGNIPDEINPPDGIDRWYQEFKVWQDSFYIAKYEARARHFQRFMQSAEVTHRDQYQEAETLGCGVQRNDAGDYFLVHPEQEMPATHLSWELANEFAHWMGFRLPTEAEWVKAARGTDQRMYPWGNEEPDDTFAGFNSPSSCSSTDITAYRKGQSPYGVYNMAGNVFEYVQDWYNVEYDMAMQDGMRNPVSNQKGSVTELDPNPRRMLKGGRWASTAEGLNVFERRLREPHTGFICFGARFAIDTDQVRQLLASGAARVLEP